jgi:hypothetical protein
MLTVETLRDLVSDGRYVVTYGHVNGRTEEYEIDHSSMYGIGSAGYKSLPLEDLDIDCIRSISKVTEIYRK